MRDNHEGLPEIIDAYERDGHFFCSIALTIGRETKVFEFGVIQESYKAVKRILSLRPFEQFPGTKYRYFYAQGWDFRIEQGTRGKQFRVEAPEPLIANLTWFIRVKDFSELAHLREIQS
jgi:hypothetical protein